MTCLLIFGETVTKQINIYFRVKIIGETESERQHGDLEEKGTVSFETKLFLPPTELKLRIF